MGVLQEDDESSGEKELNEEGLEEKEAAVMILLDHLFLSFAVVCISQL